MNPSKKIHTKLTSETQAKGATVRWVTPQGHTVLPEAMVRELGVHEKGGHVWFLKGEHRWEAWHEDDLEEMFGGKDLLVDRCKNVDPGDLNTYVIQQGWSLLPSVSPLIRRYHIGRQGSARKVLTIPATREDDSDYAETVARAIETLAYAEKRSVFAILADIKAGIPSNGQTGLDASFGKWPSEETDSQLAEALKKQDASICECSSITCHKQHEDTKCAPHEELTRK